MGKYDDDDYEPTPVDDEADDSTEKDSAEALDMSKVRKVIAGGWGKAEKVKAASSAFAERFNPTDSIQLAKFLDDEPYASYRYHWIDGRAGQKSFTCIDEIDPKGCPLCAAGNKATSKFCFNIAVFEDGEWVNKSYEGGSRLFDQLKNLHQDDKTGPLTRNYWAIGKAGKKGSVSVNHGSVKERDLEEDWNATPIDAAAMADLVKGKYDSSIIYVPKRTQLVEIAAEELGD
jgi:hypothetical protein